MIEITNFQLDSEDLGDKTVDMNFDRLDNFIQSMLDEEKNESREVTQKKMIYSGLLSEYLRRYGRSVDEDYSDLVLSEFQISDDFDKKIQILNDAFLDNGIPI